MNRLRLLKSFISFLEENLGYKFDPDDLDSRLRLQKYVFIAKFFGLDMGYKFDKYIHGPWSRNLADDIDKIKVRK